MTMQIKLSATQIEVLSISADRGGFIEPLPERLPAGARKQVISGLKVRGLIDEQLMLTDAGYAAIGKPRLAEPSSIKRGNSKQSVVIEMLQRPEGATIAQLCEVTGWQAHTVRGTFAGALKKKLGLHLTSDKTTGGDRVYRVSI